MKILLIESPFGRRRSCIDLTSEMGRRFRIIASVHRRLDRGWTAVGCSVIQTMPWRETLLQSSPRLASLKVFVYLPLDNIPTSLLTSSRHNLPTPTPTERPSLHRPRAQNSLKYPGCNLCHTPSGSYFLLAFLSLSRFPSP